MQNRLRNLILRLEMNNGFFVSYNDGIHKVDLKVQYFIFDVNWFVRTLFLLNSKLKNENLSDDELNNLIKDTIIKQINMNHNFHINGSRNTQNDADSWLWKEI